MEYVIGYDVGSQAIKVVLLSVEGGLIAESSADYPIRFPHPAWAEQEPGDWNAALIGATRDVLTMSGVRPDQVRAIGLDAQVDGIVAVDAAGAALRPAIIWMDHRATEQVCAASLQPYFDDTGLVETHCHAHPDLWLLENPGFVSGGNYRWFRDQFGREETDGAALSNNDAYEILDQGADSVPPGCDGLILLPCLMGALAPTWNPHARGTFFGFTLAHEKRHFTRAILESSAYSLRDITDRMRAMGLQLQEIRAVGGGARRALWRQIKADVTRLPVALLNTVETTALGAGMLALVGAGSFSSFEEASDMSWAPQLSRRSCVCTG